MKSKYELQDELAHHMQQKSFFKTIFMLSLLAIFLCAFFYYGEGKYIVLIIAVGVSGFYGAGWNGEETVISRIRNELKDVN